MPKNITQPDRIGFRVLAFIGIVLATVGPICAATIAALVLAVSAAGWLHNHFALDDTVYVIICIALCVGLAYLSAALSVWLMSYAARQKKTVWQRWCAGIGLYAFVTCMVVLCYYVSISGRG